MEQKIITGDCRLAIAKIRNESIDAIISDPPYGIDLCINWTGKRHAVIGDGRHEAPQLWRDFLPDAFRIAKPNTAHLFFGCWGSTWIKELLAEYFTVKGCIVWYKNTWGLGWYLRPRWELAWYCHKGKPPIPAKAMPDVWEHRRDHRLIHPCQKPISLLRQAIQLCIPSERRTPGRHPVICDPFAGIGSTGVASVAEGCRFIGVEISSDYAAIARKRIASAQSQRAAFLRGSRRLDRAYQPRSRSKRCPTSPKRARFSRAMQDSKSVV